MIVEIKDAYKPEKDPDYHTKLEMARLVYDHLGWSFRIINRRAAGLDGARVVACLGQAEMEKNGQIE